MPGVIVTQHSVDGVPVNMPTHGHGQGYSDLNFLMPELVQRIEYRKGPYFAQSGDFSSAGAADIGYVKKLDAQFGQITLGERGYQRGVAGMSFAIADGVTLMGVLQLMRNDRPWSLPEGLKRSNVVLGLSGGTAARGWTALQFTPVAARHCGAARRPGGQPGHGPDVGRQ